MGQDGHHRRYLCYHHPDELTIAAKWIAIALARVMPGALPYFATEEAIKERLDAWQDYRVALREYDEKLEAYKLEAYKKDS